MTDPRVRRSPPSPLTVPATLDESPTSALPESSSTATDEASEATHAVLLADLERSHDSEAPLDGARRAPRIRLREGLARIAREGLSDQARSELNQAAEELHTHLPSAADELAEDLLLLHRFYLTTDSRRCPEIARELTALRDLRLRPNTTLRPGADATLAQIAEAALATRISRELGHEARMSLDLQTWSDLLHHLPAEALDGRGRAEQIAAMLRDWIVVRDRFHGSESATSMHGVPLGVTRSQVLETLRGLREELLVDLRSTGISEAELGAVSAQITQAIEFDDPEAAAHLTVADLLEQAPLLVELNRQLQEASNLPDLTERRSALLSLLRDAAALGNEHYLRLIREALQQTLPENPSATDSFLLMISETTVLGRSDSYQFTLLQRQARALLDQSLSSPVDETAAQGNALIAAYTLFEILGDDASMDRLQPALRELRNTAMRELSSGAGPGDSSARVELASLAVQIDQILLATDLSELANAEAETEIRSAAPALGIRLMDSLDTLRHEVERGVEGRPWLSEPGDLPMAERLEACRLLAQSLAQYQSLTERDHPPIRREAFTERVEAVEELYQSIFAEMYPANTGDTAADAMSNNIAYDLRTRLHFALMSGDSAWPASHLTLAGIAEFGELSESAHSLLTGWGEPPTSQQIEEHLGAAAIFSQLGLENRVNETLRPVRSHAYEIEDVEQRFSFLQNLIPFYQNAGMTTEGNAVLNELAELAGHDGATEPMRQFAEIIPALREANEGHLDRATELLQALPDNPVAAATLEQMQDGVRRERLTQLTAVWSAGIQDYLATRRGEGLELAIREATGSADPTLMQRIERSLTRALQEAVSAVQRGDFDSLYEAMAASDNADVRTFLYEEFPYAELLESLSDPSMSRENFARGVLGLARSFGNEERYALAGNLASMILEDASIGVEARAFVDELEWEPYWDQAPEAATMLLLSFVGGPEIFAAYASTSFLLNPDESSAYLGMGENLIALATFGVGEYAAARVASRFVNPGVAAAMSPLARGATTWGLRSVTSAATFVPMGMASAALFGWSTEGLTAENFATQFGAMLVVFAVCHGMGMGAARLGRSLEGVPGLRASGPLAAGAPRLNWAGRSIIGVAGYGGTIAGLAGTEYINEALGLHHDESTAFYASLGLPAPTEGAPFFLRVLRSAIMDAHMRFMGRSANSVSGGMIERLNIETEGRLRFLEAQQRLLRTVEEMGFDPRSAEGQRVLCSLVGRAMRGERFEEIEASMGEREAIRRDVDRALRMVLEVNPASPRGRRLSALLIAYRQAHPEANLAELVGNTELNIRRSLREAGLRGREASELGEAMLESLLSSDMTPEQIRERLGATTTAIRAARESASSPEPSAATGREGARGELRNRLRAFLTAIFSETPGATAVTSAGAALMAAGFAANSPVATVLGLWAASWGATAMANPRIGVELSQLVGSMPESLRSEFQRLVQELSREARRVREGITAEPSEVAPLAADREASAAAEESAPLPEETSGVRPRPEAPSEPETEAGEITRRAPYEDVTRRFTPLPRESGNEEPTVPGVVGNEGLALEGALWEPGTRMVPDTAYVTTLTGEPSPLPVAERTLSYRERRQILQNALREFELPFVMASMPGATGPEGGEAGRIISVFSDTPSWSEANELSYHDFGTTLTVANEAEAQRLFDELVAREGGIGGERILPEGEGTTAAQRTFALRGTEGTSFFVHIAIASSASRVRPRSSSGVTVSEGGFSVDFSATPFPRIRHGGGTLMFEASGNDVIVRNFSSETEIRLRRGADTEVLSLSPVDPESGAGDTLNISPGDTLIFPDGSELSFIAPRMREAPVETGTETVPPPGHRRREGREETPEISGVRSTEGENPSSPLETVEALESLAATGSEPPPEAARHARATERPAARSAPVELAPLNALPEGAPQALHKVHELAGASGPLARHARALIERLPSVAVGSEAYNAIVAEATTLSEIDNATRLDSSHSEGTIYDATLGYRELALSTQETLRDLQPGSPEYRTAIESYRRERDAIGTELTAEFEAPMAEVLEFLNGLESDAETWERVSARLPDMEPPRLAEDIPLRGRTKDPSDILAKLDRRDRSRSLLSITDLAGTRVVVEGYEDAISTLAMIQERFPIYEARDGAGRVILGRDGRPSLDRDTLGRLIGRPGARPYRAMHVVVEVNGRPVEIQIQTRALNEWYDLEHRLSYERTDLPATVLGPLRDFFRESAQFLADVEQGAAFGEAPDPHEFLETLPSDLPPETRLELEEGLLQLSDLMRRTVRRYETPETGEVESGGGAEVIPFRRERNSDLPERMAADPEAPPERANPENAPPLESSAAPDTPPDAGPGSGGVMHSFGMGAAFLSGADFITPWLARIAHFVSPDLGHMMDTIPHGIIPSIIGMGVFAMMVRGNRPSAEFIAGSAGRPGTLRIASEASSVIVGRAHGLFESDSAVSGEHATIARGSDGRWYLRDGVITSDGNRRYSTNGVLLVDLRTGSTYRLPHHEARAESEWIVLDPNYAISIGHQTFTLEFGAEAPAARAEPRPEPVNPYANSGLPVLVGENGRYTLDLESLDLPSPSTVETEWRRPEAMDLGGIAAGTHEGLGYKDHNEDRYLVVSRPDGGNVIVSIDGMGGHVGGERAAAIVRAVMERALAAGLPIDRAIDLADLAVTQDNSSRGPVRHPPGAVLTAVELVPHPEGGFTANFDTIGDAATAVFDLSARGEARIRCRTETHRPGTTLIMRINPFANQVDQAVGGFHRSESGRLTHATRSERLETGNILLSGSDGFWENFSGYDEIADIMLASGETSAEGLRSVLMTEALLRMRLMEMRRAGGEEPWIITRERYESAYRDVTAGGDPPNWPWRYEGLELERGGNVVDERILELDGVVGHFKRDNVTLVVQVLGEEIRSESSRVAEDRLPPPAVADSMPGLMAADAESTGASPLEVSGHCYLPMRGGRVFGESDYLYQLILDDTDPGAGTPRLLEIRSPRALDAAELQRALDGELSIEGVSLAEGWSLRDFMEDVGGVRTRLPSAIPLEAVAADGSGEAALDFLIVSDSSEISPNSATPRLTLVDPLLSALGADPAFTLVGGNGSWRLSVQQRTIPVTVNGVERTPSEGPIALHSGDLIALGHAEFRFNGYTLVPETTADLHLSLPQA